MKTVGFLALALLSPSCGAAPLAGAVCETPAAIEVALESGPLLNPDAAGRALPTEVRLYRLRDAAAFETVAFDAIWQSDAAALWRHERAGSCHFDAVDQDTPAGRTFNA